MSDDTGIGTRIRRRRQELGLTLRQVALDGTAVSHLHAIEKGASAPSIDKAKAIAKVLGVSLAYLAGEESLSAAEDDVFVHEYLSLPPNQRRKVRKVVRAMVGSDE